MEDTPDIFDDKSELLHTELSEVFDNQELSKLKHKYRHFTVNELETALEEAKHEVNTALGQYSVINVSKSVRRDKIPKLRNVSLQTEDIPELHSDTEPSEHQDHDNSESSLSSCYELRSDVDNDLNESEAVKLLDKCSTIKPRALFSHQLNVVKNVPAKSTQSHNIPENVERSLVIKEKSNEEARVDHCLKQMDSAFTDIFNAIEVSALMGGPKDALEQKRDGKRASEFSSRFGRNLYQTRQTLQTLTGLSEKFRLSGRELSHPSHFNKLVQLLQSCRQLLNSYSHFIPMSGAKEHLYPSVLLDALEVILDVGSLAADFGVRTGELCNNIRHLEELASSSKNKTLDPGRAALLNNLAHSILGPPTRQASTMVSKSEQKNRDEFPRNSRKRTSSVLRPRGNRLLQARTNLARLKRMQGLEKDTQREWNDPRDLSGIGEELSHFPAVHQSPVMNIPTLGSITSDPISSKRPCVLDSSRSVKTLNSEWKKSVVDEDNLSLSNIRSPDLSRMQSPDLAKILKRVHNLELLASRDNGAKVHYDPNEVGPQSREDKISEEVPSIDEVDHLLNRLQIINSDFDILTEKYQSSERGNPTRTFHDRGLGPHFMQPEKLYNSSRAGSQPDVTNGPKPGNMFSVMTESLLEDIVYRVSSDILKEDFNTGDWEHQ